MHAFDNDRLEVIVGLYDAGLLQHERCRAELSCMLYYVGQLRRQSQICLFVVIGSLRVYGDMRVEAHDLVAYLVFEAEHNT